MSRQRCKRSTSASAAGHHRRPGGERQDSAHHMLGVLQDVIAAARYWEWPAFSTGTFVEQLAHFPDRIVPPWRKKREYLSRILSTNEFHRPPESSRRLFLRVRHGKSILNPVLPIEVQKDRWQSLYDALEAHLGAGGPEGLRGLMDIAAGARAYMDRHPDGAGNQERRRPQAG